MYSSKSDPSTALVWWRKSAKQASKRAAAATSEETNNLRIVGVRPLLPPACLLEELPREAAHEEVVRKGREELLGVLRVVETWGERLAGRVVLIEADNTAAVGAATKMASSAEDMQELVRRLLEACEEYGIELRLTCSASDVGVMH